MSKRDARDRMFATERKKWEFRYENQDKRLKELEATIKELRGKNRDLRKKLKELEG